MRHDRNWPKAVVFDLDGTLIDSVADIANALNVALSHRGLSPLPLPYVKDLIGGGAPRLVRHALRRHGVSRLGLLPLATDFLRSYRNNLVRHTTLFAGVRELLTSLQGDGILLGLCTNKRHDLTLKTLDELKLTSYFSAVTGERFLRRRKPHPAPLLSVLEALNTAPHEAIMVGDSIADVACAKAAGVASVAVSFGYSLVPAVDLGADAVIDRLTDLHACMDRLAVRNRFKQGVHV